METLVDSRSKKKLQFVHNSFTDSDGCLRMSVDTHMYSLNMKSPLSGVELGKNRRSFSNPQFPELRLSVCRMSPTENKMRKRKSSSKSFHFSMVLCSINNIS